MTREMDGVKRIRTRGGNDLVDHKYTKPPLWGSLAPWEFEGSGAAQELSRIGRRVWSLSFSHLSSGDLFGSNQSIGWWETGKGYQPLYTGDGYEDDDVQVSGDAPTYDGFDYNILTDDNFFSQVVHRLNGSQIPFIFQPNKDDNTEFAIAKFDMKSFKFKQVSNKLYNIKLKIREIW